MKKESYKRGIILIVGISVAITICLTILIALDAIGSINLTHPVFLSIWLAVLPHAILCFYFGITLLKTNQIKNGWILTLFLYFFLFALYFWGKINLLPHRCRPDISIRFKIMSGGRTIALGGLYALALQIVFYCFSPQILSIAGWPIFISDLIFALLSVLLLLVNGTLRIICTSKYLNVLKRVLSILLLPIPLINLAVIGYICHQAKIEYDYRCYELDNQALSAESDQCQTRYPFVLIHGVGFRDRRFFNYWGRIPRELIRRGATVYYGNQEAWGTIEYNAADIKNKILAILRETGCEKVNIIAHSKGGLDARYMISTLQMGEYVASCTMMSTPHHGCRFIDKALKIIPESIYRFISKIVNHTFRKFGDHNPDFYIACRQFTTGFCEQFNTNNPDDPRVYYQSYTSVMRSMFSDIVLSIPYLIVKFAEGENDGLVSVPSAKWGVFRGVIKNKYRRGISHGDMIDLRRDDYRGFDVRKLYVNLAAELKKRGF